MSALRELATSQPIIVHLNSDDSWCRAQISYGMCDLGVQILFTSSSDGVHWQGKHSVRETLVTQWH